MRLKKSLSLIFVLLVIISGLSASIMAAPRKVRVINTKYFDILFSDLSKETAVLMAREADGLYDKAREYLGVEETFRMPIVISPDSDALKVTYSPVPYNRIVIYEGVPDKEQAVFENSLLSLFYHQLVLAVNESIRSPFISFVNKIVQSDALQPVALLNLPFSIVEGIAFINEKDDDLETGRLNDRYFLQILAQAKLEDCFPTWFQACAIRDITPGKELALAAGSAFTAFIQQRWGFEKYVEFWTECSGLHLLFFSGIFYKVYGVSIEAAWKEFEASIPLPETLDELQRLEKHGTEFFWNDDEARYEYLLYSEYGIIWYDNIRHEVDIYDPNSPIKTRQLLFLADSIDRLSLSADGRYLTVSFSEYKKRSNFILKMTKVYDLKEREYVTDEFYVRDATIINMEDGSYALVGISVNQNYPILQVYKFDSKWRSQLEFERAFDCNTVPLSPCYAGNGKISLIICQKNQWIMAQYNLEDGEEKLWVLQDDVEQLKISNLTYMNTRPAKKGGSKVPEQIYTFQYVPKNGAAFTRFGYIELSETFEPETVILQNTDYNGGVYYPIIVNNLLYFSSHKIHNDDFIALPLQTMAFKKGSFADWEGEVNYYTPESRFQYEGDKKNLSLEEFKISKYNPMKYYMDGSTYPLVGIVSLDLDKGTKLWPGLGLTYTTQADPFNSTEVTVSGTYKFANLHYSNMENKIPDEVLEMQSQLIEEHKDFSFTTYVKNTSTPIDIAGAAIFDFNKDGQYDFDFMAGGAIDIPLGLNFRKIRFAVESKNSISTTYYDRLFAEQYPQKKSWENLQTAYTTYEISANAKYENLNQYGISSFERRGMQLGVKTYAFWDMQKVEEILAAQPELTQQNYAYASATQINVGINGLVAIPRLTPLQMVNGWVLSVPATLSLDIMGRNGTALETSSEVLLIGKEIQNGFPFMFLYFNRFGLKFGYNLALNYNTVNTPLPDLRQITAFYDVYANTHPYDHLYLKFDLDFVPPIGRFSSIIFKSECKFSYYIRTKKVKFDVNVDIKM